MALPWQKIRLRKEEEGALMCRGFKPGLQLGKGANGTVYQGEHYGDAIAIKRINLQGIGVPYVLMEMLVMKKIRHPNVVRLIDFFIVMMRFEREPQNLLIFMEYLDGGNLRGFIEENQLSEAQVAKLYGQFGSGLAFMHNRGFAHLDLKPENILLTEDKTVAKLADFGLAIQGYDIYTGEAIKIDSSVGSIEYMAPEVMYYRVYSLNNRWYIRAVYRTPPTPYCPFLADIWSMGIICFEMLHGSDVKPFNPPTKFNYQNLYPKICKIPEKLHKRFNPELHLSNAAKNFVAHHLKLKQEDRLNMDELMEDKWIVINQVLGDTVMGKTQ